MWERWGRKEEGDVGVRFWLGYLGGGVRFRKLLFFWFVGVFLVCLVVLGNLGCLLEFLR